MQGQIEAAKASKSGKTLGVKFHGDDTWYTTKHWELQGMIGQTITAQTSESEYNGALMHWLNDYQEVGASTTPADQAFDQAHAQNQGQTAPARPQPTTTNKDASIIAQALTKSCTAPGDDVQKVWSRYCSFYRFALKGVPDEPIQNPTSQGVPFDDDLSGIDSDIPF